MPTHGEAFDYFQWSDVGFALMDQKYRRRYFDVKVNDDVVNPSGGSGSILNPLEQLVIPAEEVNFFATKVCNIFVAAIPYGWKLQANEFAADWPPFRYDECVARHKETYKYFAKYETHVYTDFNIVSILESIGTGPYRSMMTATAGHMQEMCATLAEYGFKYEGDISSAVDASFFYPIYDAFYGSD